MKIYTHNQRGGVSLLTVTIGTLLFLVLTLAMTKIMAGELRQSTDAADSIKAFYASQSAGEDAILQIKQQLTTNSLSNSDCSTSTSGLTTIGGITCASIDAGGTNTIDKNINTDEGQTYYLPAGVSTLNISWDLEQADGSSVAATRHDTNGQTWSGAPPLEITFAPYAPPNRTGLAFNKRVLWPQPVGFLGAITTVSFAAATLVPDVLCNQPGLSCKNITLTNFNAVGQNLVMRIYPRFRNAHVIVTDPGGHTIYPSNATIDITARVGDSYRRTITEINVRANPYATLGNVIQGDSQVCKTFSQSQIPPNINNIQSTGTCGP